MQSQPYNLLKKAKAGDNQARNDLIDSYRPFILKVSAKFCNRHLDWRNDEELSVAMIAFNEAIDTYDATQGAAWSSYAYLVINRRLTDYARKEKQHKTHSVLHNNLSEHIPVAATTDYGQDYERLFWQDEIHSLSEKLGVYGISMKDLVTSSPKHKRVRVKLAYIASKISTDENFTDYIHQHRRLPVKEICRQFNVGRKFVENWRRYLISLFIILTEEDLVMIREFITSLIEEGNIEHAEN